MKECNKCKITIKTSHHYCPLCHQTLTGEDIPDYEELYPVKEPHIENLPPRFERIFLFISILSIVVLGIINFLNRTYGFWSLIPIGALAYFWILIKFYVFTKTNSIIKISVSTILVTTFLIFINLSLDTSDLWSIDYALPSLIMTNNFIILLIMLIQNKPFRHYAFHLFLLVLFSLTPSILYLAGVSNEYTMALLTFAHGLLMFMFMIIFFPNVLKEVLKKIFHI